MLKHEKQGVKISLTIAKMYIVGYNLLKYEDKTDAKHVRMLPYYGRMMERKRHKDYMYIIVYTLHASVTCVFSYLY